MNVLWWLILPVIILLDFTLPLWWVPFYFRIGIPFVRKKYHLPGPVDKQRLIHRLNHIFGGNWWKHGTAFQQISEDEIAFRNAGLASFQRKLDPPTGLIRFIPEYNVVVVTTYLHLSSVMAVALPIAFAIAFSASMLSTSPVDWQKFVTVFPIIVLFPIIALFFMYLSYRSQAKAAGIIARMVNASTKMEG